MSKYTALLFILKVALTVLALAVMTFKGAILTYPRMSTYVAISAMVWLSYAMLFAGVKELVRYLFYSMFGAFATLGSGWLAGLQNATRVAFSSNPYPYAPPIRHYGWIWNHRSVRLVKVWFLSKSVQVRLGRVATFVEDHWKLFLIWASSLVIAISFMVLVWASLVVAIRILRKMRAWVKTAEQDVFWKSGFSCSFSEKIMPGSDFEFQVVSPPIQCEVWASFKYDHQRTEFRPVAQAWRLGDRIITAWHAVSDAAAIRLKRGDTYLDVPYERGFENVEGDLAVFVPSVKDMAALKLKSAKLAGSDANKVMAVVTAFGKRSMGFVKPYDAMGFVQYTGSTQPGFSGAPYMLNSTIVAGIHLGGHTANIGYDAAYLKLLISRLDESSSDAIQDYDAQEELFIVPSRYDPDEFDVRVRTKRGYTYYRMDEDELNKWNPKWKDNSHGFTDAEYYYGEKKQARGKKVGYVPESDTFKVKVDGKDSFLCVPRVVRPPPKDFNPMGFKDEQVPVAVSKEAGQEIQPKAVLSPDLPTTSGTTSSEDPSSPSMDHQESTPVQQNDLSDTTQALLLLLEQCQRDATLRKRISRQFLDLSCGDFVPESKTSKNGSKKRLAKGSQS